jgi:RND family efflux transporter MFP subunit
MQIRRQIAIVAVLGAVLASGWLWLSGVGSSPGENTTDEVKDAAATPVLTEPLETAVDKIVVRAIGTGRALRSAAIHPAVEGEVIEISFKADQQVRRGQPLLRLDDEHQRLAVRLADVAVREARRQMKRLARLADKGAASRARLETAQSEVESAELRLAQAKAELADRTVFAPFDGVVGMTEIDRGDRVTEDTAVTTLDDRSKLLVEFTVPEDYAGKMSLGDKVEIRPWSAPETNIEGITTALGSRIDKTTRSLAVRAEIPNADDRLRPGGSFEVQIAFSGRRYPRVREVAVSWSRDGAYLWRVADGKVEKVFVKLVRRQRGYLLVDGPLRSGEVIVVEGVQGLRQGQPVAASAYDAKASGAAGKAEGQGS